MPLTDRERWLMLQAWEGAMGHTDERAFEIWLEAITGRSEGGAAMVTAPRATILDRQASDRFGEPMRTLPVFAHTNGQPGVLGTFRDMVERERTLLRPVKGKGHEVTHELLREIRDILRDQQKAAACSDARARIERAEWDAAVDRRAAELAAEICAKVEDHGRCEP